MESKINQLKLKIESLESKVKNLSLENSQILKAKNSLIYENSKNENIFNIEKQSL